MLFRTKFRDDKRAGSDGGIGSGFHFEALMPAARQNGRSTLTTEFAGAL
jgi:hypothetical protein